MPISLDVDVEERGLAQQLDRMGENAAKAVNRTMSTMGRRAPVMVARIGAEKYNIAAARLNPRNKRSRGKVSLAGGLAELELRYVGEKLPITDFKDMKPKGYRRTPYDISVQVVRGQVGRAGHWYRPWSEGGAYSAKSPWMFVPGVPGPVMRQGRKLGGTMRALSIPQMVVSKRTEPELQPKLRELMMDELWRNIMSI